MQRSVAPGSPDMVFVNGKIVTVDRRFGIVEAVAVTDGRFSAVGTSMEIGELADPATRVVDLEGRTVIPGFIDGHAHMDREGLKFILPSLHGARSIADVLDVIAAEVRGKEPGEWIVTMPLGDYPSFDSGCRLLAEQRYPTRWDLDRVAPDNPVYVKGVWYYWSGQSPIVSIANSTALSIAGITRHTMPPHAGLEIDKDESTGEPNGIFRESGRIGTVEYSLMAVAPRFGHDDRVAALRDSMRRYNAAGITSVYEGHGIAPAVIRAYRELWGNGELTVRSHLVMSPTWDAFADATLDDALAAMTEQVSGAGPADDMLRVGGIHVEVGDSVQDDIRKDASSNPGWAGYSVDSILPPARGSLTELLLASARSGLRVNAITHDAKSLEECLSALEVVNEEIPIGDRRFVLQHLTFVSDTNLVRLKKLGVLTTVVPGTTIWSHGLDRTIGLAQDEADTYVPLRRFLEHDVPFALSTDNVPIEPMKSLGSAVVRKDMATGRVIGRDQVISRAEALRAFTINGAQLSFEEHQKGSIEVGKFADLVVLSADILTVPPDEIHDIDVVMTVVGGVTVHEQTD
jgi:predicted amidohydrolase YtcJ